MWTPDSDNPPEWTVPLQQVRTWLKRVMSTGEAVQCPACDQTAKIYRRTINASMARALLIAYAKSTGDEYVYIPGILKEKSSADFTKLRHWGLIEDLPEAVRNDGSNRTGYWRVTDKGRDFCHGRISVPKYAVVYDNTLLRVEGVPRSIRESLGDKFDYDELMNQRWAPGEQGELL